MVIRAGEWFSWMLDGQEKGNVKSAALKKPRGTRFLSGLSVRATRPSTAVGVPYQIALAVVGSDEDAVHCVCKRPQLPCGDCGVSCVPQDRVWRLPSYGADKYG